MRTKIDGHFNTELPIKKIRSTCLKNMYCIFMIQVVDMQIIYILFYFVRHLQSCLNSQQNLRASKKHWSGCLFNCFVWFSNNAFHLII